MLNLLQRTNLIVLYPRGLQWFRHLSSPHQRSHRYSGDSWHTCNLVHLWSGGTCECWYLRASRGTHFNGTAGGSMHLYRVALLSSNALIGVGCQGWLVNTFDNWLGGTIGRYAALKHWFSAESFTEVCGLDAVATAWWAVVVRFMESS